MAKRKFGSSRDPLQVQISVRLKLPRGVKPTAALVNEAVRYRIENDEDHPFAKTRIIRWRNPARGGKKSKWRKGNQDDAWTTLAPWLRFADITTFSPR